MDFLVLSCSLKQLGAYYVNTIGYECTYCIQTNTNNACTTESQYHGYMDKYIILNYCIYLQIKKMTSLVHVRNLVIKQTNPEKQR